jgi:hypothetical protein
VVRASVDAESSRTVPASSLTDEDFSVESLTSLAPSTRQNTKESSVSTRLHCGQRFIFGMLWLDAGLA